MSAKFLIFAVSFSCCAVPVMASGVSLYAAGSLQGAMTEIDAAFTATTGIPVHAEFGPAGMLRQRIEQGAAADVFASADMDNPRKLVAEGRASFVVGFTGNRLCAIARPGLELTTQNLLDKALDPGVKLGTSTPGSDPAGDYAWQLFARADGVHPGAGAILKSKALRLVGGSQAVPAPAGQGAVPWLLANGHADMFIAYCTTGKQASRAGIALDVVELPKPLAQNVEYGLTTTRNSSPDAAQLALFMLSEPARAILARWGFGLQY